MPVQLGKNFYMGFCLVSLFVSAGDSSTLSPCLCNKTAPKKLSCLLNGCVLIQFSSNLTWLGRSDEEANEAVLVVT